MFLLIKRNGNNFLAVPLNLLTEIFAFDLKKRKQKGKKNEFNKEVSSRKDISRQINEIFLSTLYSIERERVNAKDLWIKDYRHVVELKWLIMEIIRSVKR